MWPWGHVAVAYPSARSIGRMEGRLPTGAETVLLTTASLLPDLVDKPLGWTMYSVFGGRSVAHSALVATVACTLVALFLTRRGRARSAVAFVVGYVSHLLTDGLFGLLRADLSQYAFLRWPFVPPPPPEQAIGVGARLSNSGTNVGKIPQSDQLFGGGEYFLFQIALAVVAVLLWWVDGAPGLRTTLRSVKRLSPLRDPE